MAMHVHSSFSEGAASMRQQLTAAKTNAIDVIWWSDHDWRMSAHGYRQVVHFTALTESENGVPITWRKVTSTGTATSAIAIVASPASPLDPSPSSSLSVSATGTGTSFSTARAVAKGGRDNVRSSLAGQTLAMEIYPNSMSSDTFCEIRIASSTHPATNGRPAGAYTLSYRIGGPDPAGTRRADGLTGVVVLPGTAGVWNSVVISPAGDAAALWPGLEADDLSLCELSFGVQSRNGAPARGYIDFLRFTRTVDGNAPMDVQRRLMSTYQAAFPAITQRQGLEVSLYDRHLNWFGGDVSLPDYGTLRILPEIHDDAAIAGQVAMIHNAGGVASLNHMFGTGNDLVSEDEQERRRRALAPKLISNAAFGADILEVGDRQRGGVDLSRHLAMWDACSRNGIFLTGNGVSDDHSGQGWRTSIRNFFTYAWAADTQEPSLLAALRAGRCYFGDIQRYSGWLDLLVDQVHPMGSVSIAQLPSRTLRIIATRIPSGGQVSVVTGPVDYAGPTQPDPGTTTTSLPGSAFGAGYADITVDTPTSRFVRVAVCDATGRIVGGSNPVWLLTDAGPTPIPPARLS